MFLFPFMHHILSSYQIFSHHSNTGALSDPTWANAKSKETQWPKHPIIHLINGSNMDLHIKNMVCDRCIMVVEEELKKLGLHPLSVSLGIANIKEEELSETQNKHLNQRLIELGFERVEDRKRQMIEQVKTLIVKKIHHQTLEQGFNWSSYLSQNVYHDYRYLSQLFPALESITIEQYIIRQKIEKIKELIVYNQLNLTAIADLLGYSSPAHMSNQFKKITGMTPGQFKKLRNPIRTSIDKVK